MTHHALPLRQPWILTWAPPGIRSTTGKPVPGPALRLTGSVTIPLAASAAVGTVSSNAAIKSPRSFILESSCRHERRTGAAVPDAGPRDPPTFDFVFAPHRTAVIAPTSRLIRRSNCVGNFVAVAFARVAACELSKRYSITRRARPKIVGPSLLGKQACRRALCWVTPVSFTADGQS